MTLWTFICVLCRGYVDYVGAQDKCFKKIYTSVKGGVIMGNLLACLADLLGTVALTTLDTYSWVGMYEPKKPESLAKYKG